MLFGRHKKTENEGDPARDEALNQVLRADLGIIYKHSPVCRTSAVAMRHVQDFMTRNPDIPVYTVDVVRDRKLARRLAADWGIPHESPQVVVLRQGVPRAHGSHYDITIDRLEDWCTSE
jgi:bacillithiol system protein YtxJ